jgi:ABC-2 type transport system ATP-binding protein
LFLDEPTSVLDPESVQSVNSMIKSLAEEEGVTVFLCTHQLRYAQEICSAYGLISNGVLLASGTLEELRARVSPGLAVSIKADRFPAEITARKLPENTYELTVKSEQEIPQLVRRIVEAGVGIYSVTTRKPSLEEIYFALFETHTGGKEPAHD